MEHFIAIFVTYDHVIRDSLHGEVLLEKFRNAYKSVADGREQHMAKNGVFR